MNGLLKHIRKSLMCGLLAGLLCAAFIIGASASEPVSLEVCQVRIDSLLLHVGEIRNPRPNMGIAMFTEIFEGLWLQVVTGSEERAVLPLDESGRFARVAYFADSQNEGRVLVPVVYFIFDLDNAPASMTLEDAESAALCVFYVIPEERDYAAAFAQAPTERSGPYGCWALPART